MENVATLTKDADTYSLRFPAAGLVIRGEYPEWVFEAAAEILSNAELVNSNARVEEVEVLSEFEEASDLDVDIAKSDHNSRFERIPQCVVSMKTGEFHWISAVGRKDDELSIKRIYDMSRTRNDTFLKDETADAE